MSYSPLFLSFFLSLFSNLVIFLVHILLLVNFPSTRFSFNLYPSVCPFFNVFSCKILEKILDWVANSRGDSSSFWKNSYEAFSTFPQIEFGKRRRNWFKAFELGDLKLQSKSSLGQRKIQLSPSDAISNKTTLSNVFQNIDRIYFSNSLSLCLHFYIL